MHGAPMSYVQVKSPYSATRPLCPDQPQCIFWWNGEPSPRGRSEPFRSCRALPFSWPRSSSVWTGRSPSPGGGPGGGPALRGAFPRRGGGGNECATLHDVDGANVEGTAFGRDSKRLEVALPESRIQKGVVLLRTTPCHCGFGGRDAT